MFLAFKEMKKEKARFLMIILVTILISYLVYFLSGLAFGLAKANTTGVESWNKDGIILSTASNRNIYSSTITEKAYNELNIKNAEKITVANKAVFHNKEKEQFNMVFMGLENPKSPTIPPLTGGRYIENQHEIVLSDGFKDLTKVKVNDTITISDTGRVFKIVGFTKDVKYNTAPVGYVDLEMASPAMMMYSTGNEATDANSSPTPNMPSNISGILINGNISQGTLDNYNLEYVSIKDFIQEIPGYKPQVLTFSLMIISLIIISSVIIGIFMYVLTMQKKNIFGVLKIQGLSNGYITKSVLFQTILIGIIGALLGFALTLVTFIFIPATVPIQISWTLYGIITGLSLMFSLCGAAFSARSILKIDPLDSL